MGGRFKQLTNASNYFIRVVAFVCHRRQAGIASSRSGGVFLSKLQG